MATLVELLDQIVRENPQNPAFVFYDHQISYQRVKEAIDRLAQGLLGLGIAPGDKVALMLPNTPHFPISYYSILKVGAVVVPVNIMLKESDIRYIFEDAQVKAVIAWEGFAGHVLRAAKGLVPSSNLIFLGNKIPRGTRNLIKMIASSSPLDDPQGVSETDTAAILYTAGTTAPPRGAELTHFTMSSNTLACRETLRLTPNDRLLAALPLFHPFGQTMIMNTALTLGATVVLHPKFDPEKVLDSLCRDQITVFAGTPGMFSCLVKIEGSNYDLSSLRYCLSSGSKLPIQVMKEFEDKFNVRIYEGYGLSETAYVASFNPLDIERREGSVGVPVSGVEMKIFDEYDQELKPGEIGEVVIRGPNVMKGYFNRPEATQEVMKNDWLHTGDLGKMDEDGYFYIIDRKTDLIIKGGFNVYPREVEEVLSRHPKIKEVAVIGVPDPSQGEEIKACVVLEEEATGEEIIEYCQQELANYKCPKEVEFYDSLPKGPTGKVLKRELKLTKGGSSERV